MNKLVQYDKGFLKHIQCENIMFSEGFVPIRKGLRATGWVLLL